MKFDLSSVLGFVKKNPKLVLAVGAPIIKAAVADPRLVPDLVGLTKGGDLGTFVHTHQAVVTSVASAVLAEAEANPQIVSDLLTELLPA